MGSRRLMYLYWTLLQGSRKEPDGPPALSKCLSPLLVVQAMLPVELLLPCLLRLLARFLFFLFLKYPILGENSVLAPPAAGVPASSTELKANEAMSRTTRCLLESLVHAVMILAAKLRLRTVAVRAASRRPLSA